MVPVMPKVFISYSHDSQEHLDRVLALSDRLRADGIDCEIDQYEQSPKGGWPAWTKRQIAEADFVLMVCSAAYRRRYDGDEPVGIGQGAKWEGAIITLALYGGELQDGKFFPVAFAAEDVSSIPSELTGRTRFVLSEPDAYEKLYRLITKNHAIPRRPPGEIRILPERERRSDLFGLDFARTGSTPAAGSVREGSRASLGTPRSSKGVRSPWMHGLIGALLGAGLAAAVAAAYGARQLPPNDPTGPAIVASDGYLALYGKAVESNAAWIVDSVVYCVDLEDLERNGRSVRKKRERLYYVVRPLRDFDSKQSPNLVWNEYFDAVHNGTITWAYGNHEPASGRPIETAKNYNVDLEWSGRRGEYVLMTSGADYEYELPLEDNRNFFPDRPPYRPNEDVVKYFCAGEQYYGSITIIVTSNNPDLRASVDGAVRLSGNTYRRQPAKEVPASSAAPKTLSFTWSNVYPNEGVYLQYTW